MTERDRVIQDTASSILIALTITAFAVLYALVPDIPWWAPVTGAWLGAGLHLLRLFVHARREAAR